MTSIWKQYISLDSMNAWAPNTLVANLGIVFTEFGNDYICATMPVDSRTHQPIGFLHGGASVALAETLASTAAFWASEAGNNIFGMEINANHVSAVRDGVVTGRATPVHLGRTSQVWDVHITSETGKLVCVSRMTAVVRRAS